MKKNLSKYVAKLPINSKMKPVVEGIMFVLGSITGSTICYNIAKKAAAKLKACNEEYKAQGFLIVGAYSTDGMDDDVRSVIEKNGVAYPIVRTGGNMSEFMTPYVPTTVFADGTGKILSAAPEIGAHSYDEWKTIIENYLSQV